MLVVINASESQPELPLATPASSDADRINGAVRLLITLDYTQNWIQLDWHEFQTGPAAAQARIRVTGLEELTWEILQDGKKITDHSSRHRSSLRARINRLRRAFPVDERDVSARKVFLQSDGKPSESALAMKQTGTPWLWLEDEIVFMAQDLRFQFSPLGRMLLEQAQRREDLADDELSQVLDAIPPEELPLAESYFERESRRLDRKERHRAEELARLAKLKAERDAELRRRKEAQLKREQVWRERLAAKAPAKPAAVSPRAEVSKAPLPPVPVRLELPPLVLQETAFPLPDLRGYFLRERAALWWVSNQSDDLLGLPYCNIQRLDYQLRTALRVIGPLRGRALLSDEVGLGKTIEAGLVLKEYLTRGMVKRFLVLTVPSLVDQWEEELADKFRVAVATTNHAAFRANPEAFWRGQTAIVASLHTLKQPQHAAIAQTVAWDLLIVDEAHYLRRRESQAWQAIDALPRQFLLLLTATPVQNSLEELYNLVTLLQPGQLPSPREFRARFIDKERPHRPKEPEELRRLLGQVMIRNTRANAGIHLPPRRAETVLFEPEPEEREFWKQWEGELREALSKLSPGQSSLWGRLLLQAGGSSPAAWRDAVESFPDPLAAHAWTRQPPLEKSWAKKCDLVLPLTKGEGGVVIFSQFLRTQAALAERLRAAGAPTFVINGQTPPPERQPITEEFRKCGGALLLTHSGTEGRNLQFCHRLVNFDLPWNPMGIEQRIGRLHRLGQQHPVRVYNLVQAGTLQEHLLHLLQEKLNLFELVVGETGLILGDRFTCDEFAEEILRRWRESEGCVAEALQSFGDELAAARRGYDEVKKLDDTLFAKDYESL